MTELTGSIDADGFRLHYRIEGSGLPVLVVGSARYYPRTFSHELRKHLQLIFMDHRGFAEASPASFGNADFALEKLLDDIERVRTHLGLGKVLVIGHSGHGYLALEYAKRYREQVLGAVMIGTGPSHSADCMAATEQRWRESVDPRRKEIFARDMATLEQAIAAEPERRFVVFCLKMAARSWYDPSFDATELWRDVQVTMPMFDYVWGEVFRDLDIRQGLEDFQVPVLLALGHYDFLVAPPHCWEPLRPAFADLTVRVFEQSGHTPQYEEAALFDRELRDWIAEKIGWPDEQNR